jgi:uncharacterized metal-binding protein YceD (DUF177 family)
VSTEPKPVSPFRVLVRDLPASRRIAVTPAFVAEAVKGLPLRDALDGDAATLEDGGVAEIELYSDEENVYATGKVKGTITVACSRCVGPCHIKLDEPVHVTFLPAHAMPKELDEDSADEGVELAENDLDVYPYDGEAVDLEPLVREQFVLAVPFAPLCREDCLGLCPQCGADRNHAPCACEKPVDPRFQSLQGLKLPS